MGDMAVDVCTQWEAQKAGGFSGEAKSVAPCSLTRSRTSTVEWDSPMLETDSHKIKLWIKSCICSQQRRLRTLQFKYIGYSLEPTPACVVFNPEQNPKALRSGSISQFSTYSHSALPEHIQLQALPQPQDVQFVLEGVTTCLVHRL